MSSSMAGQSTNYRDLLDLVRSIDGRGIRPDGADIEQRLAESKPVFQSLLRYKGSSAESRRQIESRTPSTPLGILELDASDVTETLLMSDELKLDEIHCLLCLLTSHEERADVTAEAGAGIYFTERRALVEALHHLLQLHALPDADAAKDIQSAADSFVESLLSETSGGRSIMIARLVELIGDDNLEPQPGARLTAVVDDRGALVERQTLVMAERTLLCECLVYTCKIKPPSLPADIAAIADLLHHLALRTRGRGAADMAAWQQASSVLAALVQALLPVEGPEGMPDEADEQRLGKLAGEPKEGQLASRLERGGAPQDGFAAVARLAWSLLLAQYGPATTRERAVAGVHQAIEVGALGFLGSSIVRGAFFEDELPFHRELYAQTFHQLLMGFLDAEPGREEVGFLFSESSKRSSKASKSDQPASPTPDALEDLLDALSAVYTVFPDLWVDPALRCDVVGQFMEYVARSSVIAEVPAARVPYLGVLTSLASGPQGAQIMFQQLRPGNSYARISWQDLFAAMKVYCERFSPGPEQQEVVQMQQSQPRHPEGVVPNSDAQALVAYLNLLAKVFREGNVPGEGSSTGPVVAWMHVLEDETGARPLWEVMFQLMCHPVPQHLKAALDDTIAALAKQPDLAGILWERLLQAVVVQPLREDTHMASLARYDISYQLNEIEARAEVYDEVISFVQLLNNLLQHLSLLHVEQSAHFTHFVLTDVFGQLHQRAYRQSKQKWDLATVCLDHMRLAVKGLMAVNSSISMHFPGMAVMLQLLGEREAMRTLGSILRGGAEQLMAERQDSPEGGAKETAVLAALRLLRAAFDRDQAAVAFLRQSELSGFDTLDGLIRRDRRWLPPLLDFANYTPNPALQVEAVKIAAILVDRLPHFSDLLLQPASAGGYPFYLQLRAGVAGILLDGLTGDSIFYTTPEEAASTGKASEVSAEDDRAELVLQLLLAGLDAPAPNVGHMLLGFGVEHGPEGVAASVLDPRLAFTCLTALLKGAQSPALPAAQPQVYERLLEVFVELASSPETCESTLDLLRQVQLVPSQLSTVVSLLGSKQGKGAVLRQCAWLLQLAALQLHRADLAVLAHREDCKRLLTSLYDVAPAAADADEAGSSAYSSIVQILQYGTYTLKEPQLSDHVPSHARKRLNLDALLGSPEVLQRDTDAGRPAIDVGALGAALQQRYREQEQDSRRYPGGADAAALSALRDACAGALRYAQERNAYADEGQGQAALVVSWQAAVEVTFTRRYEVLDGSSEGLRGGAASIAQELLETTTEVAAELLSAETAQLAPPLCQVVRVLVVRLQQQALRWTAGAAPHRTGFGSLAQSHALLKQLLLLLRLGSKREAVRGPLLDALLAYLQACRGPRIAHASADLFQAAISGPGGMDAGAVAQLDAAQAELEAGNAALLQGAPFLVEMLALQAAAPGMGAMRRTQALTVLLALVRADAGAGTLETLQTSGLLGSLLQELTGNARADLLQVPPKSRAALQVNEARLALLLQAVRTSLQLPASAHSFRLAAVDITSHLARCQAIDLQPEEPAAVLQHSKHTSLRERLLRFNVAVLRVVAAACAGLPHSKQMSAAAAEFVAAHRGALERMLGDAAALGTRAWQPGADDLEAAALALQLLQALAPHHREHRTAAAQDLWSKAFLLAERFMAHDVQRQSPVLSQVADLSEAHLASLPLHARRKLSRLVIQVRSVQRGVTSLLEALVHQGLVALPMIRQPGSAISMAPSLLLLADLLLQVSDSLVAAVDRRRSLMEGLMQSGRQPPAGSTAIQVHQGEHSQTGPAASSSSERPIQEIVDLDRQVGLLQHTAECALAVTFLQLSQGAAEGRTPEAYERLRRALLPVLHQLESVDEASDEPQLRDWSSLQMLARRTKNQLVLE
ncbi:hypothetical protein CVIRNUC_002556 [Coccomyxa viridis]|uniref:Nuclear pore complex protein Nup205 n=1 Tax=Coccomyxa viridis TaxID=1274662 RepID=A0AAV1HW18_9CHLO|nr:hypothetical protein CVIRNUC_002556 [Coccomyxa viridis]